MKKVFFVDFDGTITKKDTCNAVVEAFARDGWEDIGRLWEEKKISTEECANMLFKLLDADLEDYKRLLDTIEIDEYFKGFLSMCRDNGYQVYILSDGYDFNIERILGRHNINVKYYANKLLYDEDNGFKIECVHNNPECGRCGTCKRRLVESLKGDATQVVYIGDGYSDMCPAKYADVVFAKGALYKFCMSEGINAICYSDFLDISMRFFGKDSE